MTTIHRAYGHVDRAAVRDGAPLRVIMASEGRQADGIDLRMSGAQLDRFRSNPVLGYGHSYYGRTNLPIGRVDPGSITVQGTTLLGELQFDQADEFATEVERKMRAGFLNAVSIGFDVRQWESANDSYWNGGVATQWELTELSVVPVPMDAQAVVTGGRTLLVPAGEYDDVIDIATAVRAAVLDLARAGLHRTPSGLPGDDSPPPPAAGVPDDAARAFLAAFDLTRERHA